MTSECVEVPMIEIRTVVHTRESSPGWYSLSKLWEFEGEPVAKDELWVGGYFVASKLRMINAPVTVFPVPEYPEWGIRDYKKEMSEYLFSVLTERSSKLIESKFRKFLLDALHYYAAHLKDFPDGSNRRMVEAIKEAIARADAHEWALRKITSSSSIDQAAKGIQSDLDHSRKEIEKLDLSIRFQQ